MQTEEVVPRAQSMGIDGSLTDTTTYHHPLHLSSFIECPLSGLVHMAVKQEPQDEDDRDVKSLRSSSNEALNSQKAEASTAPTPIQVTHHGHHHGHGPTVVHQQVQQQAMDTGNGGDDGGMGRGMNQDNVSRSRPSRGRRKSRWKLKFHHQALPPEYLDHYEAALAQEALNNSSPTHGREPTVPSPTPTTATSTSTSISTSTPSPIADVQGWLQKIAAMQQELCPRVNPINNSTDNNNLQSPSRRSVITTSHMNSSGHNNNNINNNNNNHHSQQTTPRPPMKYSDLPYMGEITLDNSKPRRGRKPKKADICHLIYKNYGTILPGTPGHDERKQLLKQEQLRIDSTNNRDITPITSQVTTFQRTEIQNRISSLLEKRLTQESKRCLAISENNNNNEINITNNNTNNNREQNEPLNLCIKDLNQLKIRLLRKHGNIYESGHVKSETSSDGEEIECLGMPLSKIDTKQCNSDLLNNITNNNNNNNIDIHNNNTKNDKDTPNNFVYWPNTGVLIHPMTLQSQFLYYQKMSEGDKNIQLIDNNTKEQKIVPKSIYTMLDTKNLNTNQSIIQQQQTINQSGSPRPKRIAPLGQPPNLPTKRKRSAIFIPPMPTENNNNPATEVSICKFKFTGGAKPSLQEKKSLSVDSGGNFRYYSGTGDKSMRGYEFFPRESLQQPPGQAGSSAGAFLSATGERIPPPICQQTSNLAHDDGRKKRKTRKSLQREKLEQTFKEKGFLIQTQQLESAEGATYCKFRQLRKFTRYLFRSWKDYLPGNVRELNTTNNIDGETTLDVDVADGDNLPSPLPISNIISNEISINNTNNNINNNINSNDNNIDEHQRALSLT
ncbi:hypothetical protein PV325_005579 [Microctonus aethiopoides]|nr:hypothetical protein PV325_005579 [Microctonus aethiopoides]